MCCQSLLDLREEVCSSAFSVSGESPRASEEMTEFNQSQVVLGRLSSSIKGFHESSVEC